MDGSADKKTCTSSLTKQFCIPDRLMIPVKTEKLRIELTQCAPER